jgi:hypothetical protein
MVTILSHGQETVLGHLPTASRFGRKLLEPGDQLLCSGLLKQLIKAIELTVYPAVNSEDGRDCAFE